MNVQRGEVSTIEPTRDREGNPNYARIVSELADGVITKPLVIPYALRKGSLQKGAKVIYVEFADHSGVILMRADGEEDKQGG